MRIITALGLAAATLGLAACGSSAPSAPSAQSKSSAPSAPASSAPPSTTYAAGEQAAEQATAAAVSQDGGNAEYCAGLDPTPGAASTDGQPPSDYSGVGIYTPIGSPWWQGCIYELKARNIFIN